MIHIFIYEVISFYKATVKSVFISEQIKIQFKKNTYHFRCRATLARRAPIIQISATSWRALHPKSIQSAPPYPFRDDPSISFKPGLTKHTISVYIYIYIFIRVCSFIHTPNSLSFPCRRIRCGRLWSPFFIDYHQRRRCRINHDIKYPKQGSLSIEKKIEFRGIDRQK